MSREGRPNAGLYEDARVYDILHAGGTAHEVRTLERILERWLPQRPLPRAAASGAARPRPLSLLEPACGTGRYLRLLARRGHRVVGFDREPAMIAYARAAFARATYARAPAGGAAAPSLFVAEMTSFAGRLTRRVDAAFNLINTIRHLGSDRALVAHLEQVRRSLRGGGVYVVGISLSAYGLEFPSEDVWSGGRGRFSVRQIVAYEPPAPGSRRERVYSHLVIRRGGREEHRDSAYWLRTYSEPQWRACIRAGGFTVRAVVDARGETCTPSAPGYAIWVLAPKD